MVPTATAKKIALVYGANGALGRQIVQAFHAADYQVAAIDFSMNTTANWSIVLNPSMSPKVSFSTINEKLSELLAPSSKKLDAIVNVAGGWAGGNLLDDKLIENVDLMISQSVNSSVIAAKLAALHLKAEGGLLVLTGAAAAAQGTPSMLAYGMAKAAVHHLVKSCAVEGSGLPITSSTIGICPIMLDTPMNRKFMAEGTDTSTWTGLSEISGKLLQWAEGKELPISGSLIQIQTVANETAWTPISQ